MSTPRNKEAPNRNGVCATMEGMVLNQQFPDWLQSELDKRQWSQSDLARAAGLSRAVINKLLSGKTFPHPYTLQSIAHALKIPVETTYRVAGLLPRSTDADAFGAELIHKLKLIKSPQRRETALRLVKALIDEEEKEKHAHKRFV